MNKISKNQTKYIQSLSNKKKRDEHQVFVVEGIKMVSELLPLLKCQHLVALNEDAFKLPHKSIENYSLATEEDFKKISSQKTPQNILAIFHKPNYNISSINYEKELILALDEVQDPGNLGTIIRLADWYGIKHIICSKKCADAFNPKVVQATMGAIARVEIHYADLKDIIIKNRNTPIYATLLDGENIYEQTLTPNGIIIMGNEGNGISEEIKQLVNKKLFIPRFNPSDDSTESLNVAIATAIVCAEFRRRIL